MTDSKSVVYQERRITFHEDAGHIVIHNNVVVYAAPTLDEAKAWVDQDIAKAKRLVHLIGETDEAS